MKRVALLLTIIIGITACSDSSPVAPDAPIELSKSDSRDPEAVRVRNANDAGPGSFRAAIEAANANSAIRRIEFADRVGVVHLQQTVHYTGPQALAIDGNEAGLDGAALPADASAFTASGGGDLAISELKVANAPGNGVAVEIPATASGLKSVSLVQVAIIGNRGHGVVINDQSAPEEAGDPDASPPIPPNMTGSPASLRVLVVASRFEANGFGALDRDGLRINEGGDGDLHAVIRLTRAIDNGADGIELDERGSGDARFEIVGSHFSGNGSFDTSPDPDLDDGIDVDESGPGHLIGRVSLSSANDNLEEGFDLNENDAGDFRVDMTLVEASRNSEEGIDFEEDDDFAGGGDLIAHLAGIKTNGNGAPGDAGLKIREKGDGNLDASVAGLEASDNLTRGVQFREDALGNLNAVVRFASADRNASHGADFDENSSGDLTAIVADSRSRDNGGFGVRADNQAPGVGSLRLDRVTLSGNASGPISAGGVVVTQSP